MDNDTVLAFRCHIHDLKKVLKKEQKSHQNQSIPQGKSHEINRIFQNHRTPNTLFLPLTLRGAEVWMEENVSLKVWRRDLEEIGWKH